MDDEAKPLSGSALRALTSRAARLGAMRLRAGLAHARNLPRFAQAARVSGLPARIPRPDQRWLWWSAGVSPFICVILLAWINAMLRGAPAAEPETQRPAPVQMAEARPAVRTIDLTPEPQPLAEVSRTPSPSDVETTNSIPSHVQTGTAAAGPAEAGPGEETARLLLGRATRSASRAQRRMRAYARLGLPLALEQVQTGGRTRYMVATRDPIPAAEARDICARLAARRMRCLIVSD